MKATFGWAGSILKALADLCSMTWRSRNELSNDQLRTSSVLNTPTNTTVASVTVEEDTEVTVPRRTTMTQSVRLDLAATFEGFALANNGEIMTPSRSTSTYLHLYPHPILRFLSFAQAQANSSCFAKDVILKGKPSVVEQGATEAAAGVISRIVALDFPYVTTKRNKAQRNKWGTEPFFGPVRRGEESLPAIAKAFFDDSSSFRLPLSLRRHWHLVLQSSSHRSLLVLLELFGFLPVVGR